MRNGERGLADVLLSCSQASQIMYNRASVNGAISKSLVSAVSNVWTVMLGDGQCFLITPAHHLFHKDDFGMHWTKVGSNLDPELSSKKWRMPTDAAFGARFWPASDLVFCETAFSTSRSYLRLHKGPILEPADAYLYYNYSVVSNEDGKTSTALAAKDVLVWNSCIRLDLLQGGDG
jgi:hypothetical protein